MARITNRGVGTLRHYLTPRIVFTDVTERTRQEPSVPQAPCGGIGAPDLTVTPLSQPTNAKSTLVCDDARLQRDAGVNRGLRVHNWYLCDRCPLEWDEYSLFEGPAWCPCCDEETQPYDSIDLREDAA